MSPPKLMLEKRREINEVFSAYGDFTVRIIGSEDLVNLSRVPDVEILVNLDETEDADLVVFVPQTSQVLAQIRAVERHDFCMDVIFKLKALLGCSVNIVDERGMKNSYPITLSKLYRA